MPAIQVYKFPNVIMQTKIENTLPYNQVQLDHNYLLRQSDLPNFLLCICLLPFSWLNIGFHTACMHACMQSLDLMPSVCNYM